MEMRASQTCEMSQNISLTILNIPTMILFLTWNRFIFEGVFA